MLQVKWALAHADIDFSALLPSQMVNHFPNTSVELGAKVGLHRNLRSLEWFEGASGASMDEFLPRMFNCANPWELQDFCENFFFTAAAIEVKRFRQGLPPTSVAAAAAAHGGEAARRAVLAAAHGMCRRYLDNQLCLKGKGGRSREQGAVEGVLLLRDYYKVRPDLAPKGLAGEGEEGGEEEAPAWAAFEEEEVARLMGEMHR